MKTTIRINMTQLTIKKEETDSYSFGIGGRALTSAIVASEVPPAAEPLGPENKVVIAPGSLSGSGAPCSGRLSVGSKSPLTGGIKESNSGGMAAIRLANMGRDAVVIEGQPAGNNIYILRLGQRQTTLEGANECRGMGNYAMTEKLLKENQNAAVISLGPSGENGLSAAGIAVSDMEGRPCRFAARGGLGAVLGSKGIKAIVIERGDRNSRLAVDVEGFKKYQKEFALELKQTKNVMTEYGTASLVELVNKIGGLPTNNYSQGQFDEAEKINAYTLRNNIDNRKGKPSHSCHPGCPIRCSNVYNDADGNYLTASLEYETIAMLGSNCGISDLDAVAAMDRLCDDYGLDTIEMGASIAIAMEAGCLDFGDADHAFELIRQTGEKSSILGRVIGHGAALTAKVLGVKRGPVVKGQSMAAYDPRVFKGTGITYVTSPMGADHTAGNLLPGKAGYSLDTKEGADIGKVEGQGLLSEEIQIITAVLDLTGTCLFAGTTEKNLDYLAKMLGALYGKDVGIFDLIKWAKKTIQIELKFNEAAGFNKAQNRLPEFFRREKLSPRGVVFDIPNSQIDRVFSD